jgi:hypothetical protein
MKQQLRAVLTCSNKFVAEAASVTGTGCQAARGGRFVEQRACSISNSTGASRRSVGAVLWCLQQVHACR